MNSLSNSIYHFYLSNLDKLPLDKQFHFASRLALWNGDIPSKNVLNDLQALLLPDNDILAALTAIQAGKTFPLLPGNASLVGIRQAYNERFPQLRDAARLLYWATMFQHAFNIDTQPAIRAMLPESAMHELYDTLLADREAIAMLSTHAINFLYLYGHYYTASKPVPPELGIDIAADPALYSDTDPLHLKLCLYMLTHTIIADTSFYALPLPAASINQHHHTLKYAESVIANKRQLIGLDNKLEFLVCCRLAGYETTLEAVILDEAESSLSPEGTFIIDKRLAQPPAAQTFTAAEHRTVLYLMAVQPRDSDKLFK